MNRQKAMVITVTTIEFVILVNDIFLWTFVEKMYLFKYLQINPEVFKTEME